jgi:serine/threonine protein kinase
MDASLLMNADLTESLDSSQLARGTRIAGRFQIDCCIGAGGMGEVYRAMDLELEQIVALKFMRQGRLGNAAMASSLRREVRTARAISSPHVARMFELHVTADAVFLVMEYIEGTSLATVQQSQRRQPLGRAVIIARDVLLGLAAAHAVGVIHRDVKPGNILLRQSGQALLADFGIARLMQHKSDHATGGPTGTPSYMAPEQVLGGQVGPSADIFAAGVVLFELISGQLPWTGPTALAVALARLNEPPLSLRDLAPHAPPPLVAWVARAMERDPAHRWPSAQAAADALAVAAGQHEETGFHDAGLYGRTPQRSANNFPSYESGNLPSSGRTPGRGPSRTDLPAQSLGPGSGLPRVAVLPFRVQKPLPADQQAVAGLDDDLVTALSGYRGLRVLSPASIAQQVDSSVAWQSFAEALGATHVVEGAVRSTGVGVRINLRLISVADEHVCWSNKLDATPGELLDAGDAMAVAIAQALGAVETGPERPQLTDTRSAQLYLSARANLQSEQPARVGVAIALLEEAMRLAPLDRILPAMLALATVRHWQMTGAENPARLMRARTLLAGLAGQSDLPAEAYLASGVITYLMGDAVGAMRALRLAVARAPSLAQAHELAGVLLLGADRGEDGIARVMAAETLAPELLAGRLARCQWLALQGDWSAHDVAVADLTTLVRVPGARVSLWQWRLRAAMWQRDVRQLTALRAELQSVGGINADDPAMRYLLGACTWALDASQPIAAVNGSSSHCAAVIAERLQLHAEIAALHGDGATALVSAAAALGMGITATAWLRRCPLLDEFRSGVAWQPLVDRANRRSVALLHAMHAQETD